MVRRLKPGEQPGEEATKKSCWCVRGDLDPDAVLLNSYSPTVATQNVQVILQLAASLCMPGTCGDLKSAFMQSDPLKRERGELFVLLPAGGLPGLDDEQLVQIIGGVYGLVDAPLHWRRTLTAYLRDELHYHQSCLGPTIYYLHVDALL